MKPINFTTQVKQLFIDAKLPYDDLVGSHKVSLFGQEKNGQLVGMVGLEAYAESALLRSLVIAPSERGYGLGLNMVLYAEQQALTSGVNKLYLLTTTAEKFFERLGYSVLKRTDAPIEIVSTAQFSDLCPASAVFMSKQLCSNRPLTPSS